MNNTLQKFTAVRNDVNSIIDELVKESLSDFETFEEAIQAIKKLKWQLIGYLGEAIINEAIEKIQKIALKKATD